MNMIFVNWIVILDYKEYVKIWECYKI